MVSKVNRSKLPIFLIFVSCLSVAASNNKDVDDMLNSCLKGINHKSTPGPEDDLHQHCTPWKERSCCTSNTTQKVHNVNMYGFDYNHCGPQHTMSEGCKRHFIQDLCFYECSPDIGPWIQKVNMKIRTERYYQVPLCAVDCDAWFEACKDDYTCTDNWSRNFRWVNGVNVCPEHSTCQTFQEVFRNSSNFCERVWDYSWKYTADSEPCMRIWFDGSRGNPNTAVAKRKALQLVNSAHGVHPYHGLLLSLFFVVVLQA